MSLVPALHQLLADVEGRLAAAQLQLGDLYKLVEELQAERYGLQLALARRAEQQQPPVSIQPLPVDHADRGADDTPDPVYWQLLSRAEAVERVLEASDRPLTRQEVVAILQQAGRQEDTPDAVSAALAYLQRIDRAARTGRSQWVYRAGPPET